MLRLDVIKNISTATTRRFLVFKNLSFDFQINFEWFWVNLTPLNARTFSLFPAFPRTNSVLQHNIYESNERNQTKCHQGSHKAIAYSNGTFFHRFWGRATAITRGPQGTLGLTASPGPTEWPRAHVTRRLWVTKCTIPRLRHEMTLAAEEKRGGRPKM